MEKLEYEGLISFRSFIECFNMGELDFFNLPDEEYFELTDYIEIQKLKKEYFQRQINSFVKKMSSINSNIVDVVPMFDIENPLGIVLNNKSIHPVYKEDNIWKSSAYNCDNITDLLDLIYKIYIEVFNNDFTINTASNYFSITHNLYNNVIKYDEVPILFIDDNCNILNNKYVNKELNETFKEKGYKKLTKNESKNLIKKLYIRAEK